MERFPLISVSFSTDSKGTAFLLHSMVSFQEALCQPLKDVLWSRDDRNIGADASEKLLPYPHWSLEGPFPFQSFSQSITSYSIQEEEMAYFKASTLYIPSGINVQIQRRPTINTPSTGSPAGCQISQAYFFGDRVYGFYPRSYKHMNWRVKYKIRSLLH